jgi:hypothetical protein
MHLKEAPYVMMKKEATDEHATDMYRGFCIEMLQKISSLCNFTYEIKIVPDGTLNETKTFFFIN